MKKELEDLIQFRHSTAEDLGFIYSSWLKGLYYGNDWFNAIDQETYYETYHKVIEAILFKPDTAILVASLKEDPDVIVGYSITRNKTLDWVFVKPIWRKAGISKKLVPSTIDLCTHLTKVGRAIKPKHWKFDPFIK